MTATTNSLKYPVLQLSGGLIFPAESEDALTTCSKTALKNNFFLGQLIIDSDGNVSKVKEAVKLHGIGMLWGYNVFLNQRIKVKLILDKNIETFAVDEVKQLTLKAVESSHGWAGSSDVIDIKNSIENATSVGEITKIVTDAYGKR